MAKTDPVKLLNVDEVAVQLGVSKSNLYRLRCYDPKRIPPAIKVGSHLRWRQCDIDKWLDEQAKQSETEQREQTEQAEREEVSK
ncbi:helix-turn-helix transcriptional regulator [Bifidobacterium panos]|uniref:Helix-turn-helix domain-containing protein n=1 Tax=Bifidobacterium panos TaxID=2675321 RepID=A0ABX1SWX6_9BIFI|nr:helix-turn-helix domain-containing protein [Bifidobacterium sp. DSM 109963]NMN02356.1 Helix-turn-helix domain-containing protein [Bifidobacterium sp. DSM 109963]